LNRHALRLLACGAIAVVIRQWRQWPRDKVAVEQRCAERRVLPVLARTPRVSVLVAAWNEEANIEAYIGSFLRLSYPCIELILCAGGSDPTLDVARRHEGEKIIVLEQAAGEGKQRSLARCLERASGDLIYLSDADCILSDEALLRLLAPIVNEGEAVASGKVRPLDTQLASPLPYYLWAADVASSLRQPPYGQGLQGANSCVTRVALDQIGGLSFPAPTGTDYHLARRLIGAGLRIRNVGASVVATEYPESLGVYRRRQSRWLRNLLTYGRQYGAQSDVRSTLKTITVGVAMLCMPSVCALCGRVVMIGWLLLLCNTLCAKARYIGMTARLMGTAPPRRLWLALLPLSLADFAVWASPCIDMLSNRRRRRW
jgi:cellulose synthase/poly-beta-1,6-N-acetylglucosamine synthase-like glycosyltransferase